MQVTAIRIDTRAGIRAAAAGIRWAHEVEREVQAAPDAESVHRADAGDLGVQSSGLALFRVGVLADVHAAGGARDLSVLQRGANIARTRATAKQFVGRGDVTE